MKKLLFMILALVGAASAQTCVTLPFTMTTNLLLPLPAYNQCNWGSQGYNVGMARIDALFPGGILSVVRGGNGTATPQLIAGTNITITGAWPNYTINSTNGGATWGGITGTLSNQIDLQNALNLKAPLASPSLTGVPTAPTAAPATNTTQVATTAFVLANAGSLGNLTGPITSVGAATTVAPTGIVSQKPDTLTAIEYVAVTCAGGIACSDSNDGLSWGTAKADIVSALLALPGGHASAPAQSGVGAVYVVDGVYAHPNHSCGLFLLSAGDPGYASPPTCWIRLNVASVVCASGVLGTSNMQTPVCGIQGNLGTGATNAGLWVSGSSASLQFQGLSFQQAHPIRIGVCSDLSSADCGVVNLTLIRDQAATPGCATCGPGLEITSSSFNISSYNSTFDGNSSTIDPTLDAAAAVLIDGRNATQEGPITISGGVMNLGGLKFYGGSGSNILLLENFYTEGEVEAAVWLVSRGGGLSATMEHIIVADCSVVGCYSLKNELPIGENPNIKAGGMYGATLGGFTSTGANFPTYDPAVLPSVSRSIGLFGHHVYGDIDAGRRLFAPTAVRTANLATTAPGGWTLCGTCSLSTITGMDGVANAAGQVSTSSGSQQEVYFYSQNSASIAVGDYFLAGVWIQSQNGNGFVSDVPAQFRLNGLAIGAGDTCAATGTGAVGAFSYSSNGWGWYSAICKVTAAPTLAGLQLVGFVDSTHPAQFYAPIVLKFPSGTISDNEANEYFAALSSYGTACPAGSICGLPGQKLAESSFGVMGTTGIISILPQSAAGTYNFNLPISAGTAGQKLTSQGGGSTAMTWTNTVWQGCKGGIGDGLNAVPAATYLESTCYNNTGFTVTLSGLRCFTDNNGTTTMNVTNSAGTALLTGAVTCTTTYAAGTQSATVTLASGDWLKFTFVFDGTSKQIDAPVAGSF